MEPALVPKYAAEKDAELGAAQHDKQALLTEVESLRARLARASPVHGDTARTDLGPRQADSGRYAQPVLPPTTRTTSGGQSNGNDFW